MTEKILNDNEKNFSRTEKVFHELLEKDYVKEGAVIAALFSIGIWIIKSLWYAYQSGRFSVYGIDRCYINLDNENIFLQVIQLVAIVVVWAFVNYIYYKISISEDDAKGHWKRKLKLLLFWLLEMLVLAGIVIIMAKIKIPDLIQEMTPKYVIYMLFALFLLSLMINIYGIEFSVDYKIAKRKINKKGAEMNEGSTGNKEISYQRIRDIAVIIIATIAIEMGVVYFLGVKFESDKQDYKIIMTESDLKDTSEYCFYYGELGCGYEIYPIIYENQDSYIVSRLYKDEGKIKIEYEYQKILAKDNIETFKVDNIYKIRKGD